MRLKWEKGRQQSGYDKLKIVQSMKPLPFDIYILKFRPGSFIVPHVDKVKAGFKHYRMNIILIKSSSGGDFESETTVINWPRFKLFRPDISKHSVSTVEGTRSRWVLSIGWLTRN